MASSSSSSSSPVDAAAIKALIQSGDLPQLQEAVAHFDATFQQFEDTSVQHQQYCKLLIILYNRILQLQVLQSPPQDRVVTLHRIARLWSDVGEYSKAIAQLNKALDLATTSHVPSQQAPTLQLIGDAYMDSSDYAAAIDHHQRAIAFLSSETLPSRPADLATAHARLAEVCEASGDFDGASKALQEAVALISNDGGGDEGDTKASASVYGQLGTLQYKIGLYKEAVENLRTSHQLYQSLEADSAKAKDMEYMLQMATSLAG
jgi:tetratricopeptide (TPR) repeat protein